MDTLISIISAIDTALTVGFWLGLAALALALLSALRRALRGPTWAPVPTPAPPGFNPRSSRARSAAHKWADSDHPDAAFKWARAAGWPMGARTRGLDPLSCGGGRAYDGENGPLGFTTRDAELLDAYFAAANSIGAECGGYVVVATNGEEWDRYNGGGRWWSSKHARSRGRGALRTDTSAASRTRRPQQGEAGP